MPTFQPSPDLIRELESSVRQAVHILTRVMEIAQRTPADDPLPKPLTQARLAATQILRFAARLFGVDAVATPGRARSTSVEITPRACQPPPPGTSPAEIGPAPFRGPAPLAGPSGRSAARMMASAGAVPTGVPVAAA